MARVSGPKCQRTEGDTKRGYVNLNTALTQETEVTRLLLGQEASLPGVR